MNTQSLLNRPLTRMTRKVARASLVAVLAAAGLSAHAGGGVYWAVNVDAPLQGMGRVATSVSNAPYGGQQVYVQQQPVYVQQQPVYVQQQPVYVQPQPVYVQPRQVYAPMPVVYAPAPVQIRPWGFRPEWAWGHHHHHDHDRDWGERDGRGDWGGRDEGRREHHDR